MILTCLKEILLLHIFVSKIFGSNCFLHKTYPKQLRSIIFNFVTYLIRKTKVPNEFACVGIFLHLFLPLISMRFATLLSMANLMNN